MVAVGGGEVKVVVVVVVADVTMLSGSAATSIMTCGGREYTEGSWMVSQYAVAMSPLAGRT